MKIRVNYVSNSSSSSFIACGYLIEDKDLSRYWELVKKLVPELVEKYDNDFEYFRDEIGYKFTHNGISIRYGDYDNGLPEGKTFIGKFLGTFDEEHQSDDIVLNVSDIENELKDYKKYFKKDENNIKIITGTMVT